MASTAGSDTPQLDKALEELVLGPCRKTIESGCYRGQPRLIPPPTPSIIRVQLDDLNLADCSLLGSGQYGSVFQARHFVRRMGI